MFVFVCSDIRIPHHTLHISFDCQMHVRMNIYTFLHSIKLLAALLSSVLHLNCACIVSILCFSLVLRYMPIIILPLFECDVVCVLVLLLSWWKKKTTTVERSFLMMLILCVCKFLLHSQAHCSCGPVWSIEKNWNKDAITFNVQLILARQQNSQMF